MLVSLFMTQFPNYVILYKDRFNISKGLLCALNDKAVNYCSTFKRCNRLACNLYRKQVLFIYLQHFKWFPKPRNTASDKSKCKWSRKWIRQSIYRVSVCPSVNMRSAV